MAQEYVVTGKKPRNRALRQEGAVASFKPGERPRRTGERSQRWSDHSLEEGEAGAGGAAGLKQGERPCNAMRTVKKKIRPGAKHRHRNVHRAFRICSLLG